jgi:hypothetical protein
MSEESKTPSNAGAKFRTFFRIVIFVGFVLITLKLFSWSMLQLEAHPNLMVGLTVILLLCYALFISIPFVPAIEIAISIMIVKGADAAIWVYIATVGGLYLSFLVGHFVWYEFLYRIFNALRMKRACALLESLQPLNADERLGLLRSKAPKFIQPFIVEGRYLVVAAALNLPGNIVMGGGGGILMAAGLTRVFSAYWILLTLLIAVSPVPLAVLVFDIDPMSMLRSE